MNSYQKKTRVGIVLIPALILCLSLTQDAFIYEYQGKQTHSSISIFLTGGFAILGGGILEWLTWLANPIALISCIRFLKETNSQVKVAPPFDFRTRKTEANSRWHSLIAAALAWSFSLWDKILASESGTTGAILSLEYGYWLWVSSLTALSIGINTYYLCSGRNSNPNLKTSAEKTDFHRS